MSATGDKLFGRKFSLTVAPVGSDGVLGAIESAMGFDVSNLRCSFKVKKNLKPDPNTCEIKVYNLASTSRKVLEGASKLVVRLEAGYEETGVSQLYLGEVRSAWTEWQGPDAVTTITTGDSEKDIQEARIHVSIGPGTPVSTALTAIVRALGVGPGNVASAVQLLTTKGVAAMFGPGTVISGNAARELTDFCRSAGLEWSLQDGNIQILDRNKALSDKAIELSATTGLIGSPTIDFNATSKKVVGGLLVKAKCLIIPEIAPGRKVLFNSRDVNGGYRIDDVEWTGDTHGAPWYCEIAARKY